jgi:hypothetical protein
MLADKVSPRFTILVADASRFVLVVMFAVLAARHDVSIAALGPLAALIGAGESMTSAPKPRSSKVSISFGLVGGLCAIRVPLKKLGNDGRARPTP